MVTRLGLAQRTDLREFTQANLLWYPWKFGRDSALPESGCNGTRRGKLLRTIRHRYRGVAGICETGLTVSEPS
jgi:hypothetical protein